MNSPLYFDNAATSWPKPPAVRAAVLHYLDAVGANPGRSGHHLSIEAGRLVDAAREAVATLFHAPNPLRVAFGANTTAALNLALCGWLRPGDHVLTSSMEHNAVMRPLRELARHGVELTVVPCAPDGTLDAARIETALRPNTTLIALNHASNVAGTLLPIGEAGQIARRHGALLLVDTASTGGAFPVDMQADAIDLLAFAGHKGLLGPTGTGGLIIGDRVDPSRLLPILRGGTGSRSASEEQPTMLPDRYESGTLNVMGLAGLSAGVEWVLARGVETIRAHCIDITRALLDGLREIPGLTVYGTGDAERQVGTVSFNIEGVSPSDAGYLLDEEFGIQCRVGLHCAPSAHRTLGSFPDGTIRFAPGPWATRDEVCRALAAVRAIASRGGRI